MTPSDRVSTALATLRWGPATLARAIGVNVRTVQRWINGQNPPLMPIVEWLDRLAAFHRDNPPPERKEIT